MPLLETLNLRHRYGEREVLCGVSLTLEKGEFVAVIGPSGAGKTTLLRLIDLLEEPAAGERYFGGQPYPSSPGDKLALRRRIGYVRQQPAVFNMSVTDNVARGLLWRGVPRREIGGRVARMLELVQMGHLAAKSALTLSGGEAQRVAIARALITEPELLLLDEPTANLDRLAVQNFEGLLREVLAQYHTTILMSTHDLAQGRRLADRIGVMLDGRLARSGGAEDVFKLPGSREVAEFIGLENIVPGRVIEYEAGIVTVEVGGHRVEAVADFPVGTAVDVCLRAEDVTLALATAASSARNHLSGRVSGILRQGPLASVSIDCGFKLEALVTWKSAAEMGLAADAAVEISFKAAAVHVVPRQTVS
jgi:tungstate transport system ATP-binding protein